MHSHSTHDNSPRQENAHLKKYRLSITFRADAVTLVNDCSAQLAPIAQEDGISKFEVEGPDLGVRADNKSLVIHTKDRFILNISVYSEKSSSDHYQFTVCGLVWLPDNTSTATKAFHPDKHTRYKTTANTGFGKPIMCNDDSVSVEIDPTKTGTGNEFFVLVQAPNGAFGIVDPKATTR